MARVLITGGTGFIGRHLADALRAHGHAVVQTSRSRGEHVLDVTMREMAMNVMCAERPEWVFHLAADTRQADTAEIARDMTRVNVEGTRNMLDAAAACGVAAFVAAGTLAEYGDAPRPFVEDGPLRPLTPYGRTKQAATSLVCEYGNGVLPAVALRFSNVYGSGMSRDSFMERLRRAARGGDRVAATAALERDFVHVDDVVAALVLSAVRSRERSGEALNICSGKAYAMDAIVHIAERMLELPPRSLMEDRPFVPRPGQQSSNAASNEKARRMLGWQPRIRLEVGLRALIDGAPT
jgi:nucleoside-diphosphate-sugar epimerase